MGYWEDLMNYNPETGEIAKPNPPIDYNLYSGKKEKLNPTAQAAVDFMKKQSEERKKFQSLETEVED